MRTLQKADGVIAYLDARNIKGRNVFVTPDAFGNVETEEVDKLTNFLKCDDLYITIMSANPDRCFVVVQ